MTLHLYEPVCSTCRYWSQMIAQVQGSVVQAACLDPANEGAVLYTSERHTCASWASNHHGAVDEPPDYGESARAAYEAEAKSCP